MTPSLRLLTFTQAAALVGCSARTIRRWAERGMFMVICPACGWKGAPYPSCLTCPKCDSTALRDDHAAFPVPEKKP